MRSPFDADFPPPPQPPAGLEPGSDAAWVQAVESWTPDNEAADRQLVILLARADQTRLPLPIRERLLVEAERVLAEHLPEHEGKGHPHCRHCSARYGGFRVLFPCWATLIARRVTGTHHDRNGTELVDAEGSDAAQGGGTLDSFKRGSDVRP